MSHLKLLIVLHIIVFSCLVVKYCFSWHYAAFFINIFVYFAYGISFLYRHQTAAAPPIRWGRWVNGGLCSIELALTETKSWSYVLRHPLRLFYSPAKYGFGDLYCANSRHLSVLHCAHHRSPPHPPILGSRCYCCCVDVSDRKPSASLLQVEQSLLLC